MGRTVSQLKYGYKFKYFDIGCADVSAFFGDFDDSAWETVRVPHDWAIGGEFKEDNDKRPKHKPSESGETVFYSGTTGALSTVGEGIYRLWVDIPASASGKCVTLELDGVMWQSTVYCNGKKVGSCHFGYKSFEVDIADAVKPGQKNLIAVHAVVGENCGRWYSGGGIFRNVRLVTKSPSHIAYNGIWMRQLCINRSDAVFELTVDTVNADGLTVNATVTDPNGKTSAEVSFKGSCEVIKIPDHILWDIDSPMLYTLCVTLTDGEGNILDDASLEFGIRRSEFTREGYFLNGKPFRFHGVCMHHDLGSIGAAVNVSALKRQLTLLKKMGVNSIRTSHNPPAPELLELCDRMGFVVMDEFFDEWKIGKVVNGYSNYFEKHAVGDLTDIIRRDRNHPCVIMWSIGNEIKEQYDPEGWRIAKLLSEATHLADPDRPVTAGLDANRPAADNNLTPYLDIIGLNYKPHCYRAWHEEFPDMLILGSETESCVSTRGVYHFPPEPEIPAKIFPDLAVSEYELSAPAWAYYCERELAAQEDCPYILGEYIWTGFDYLGEPTPYLEQWPSRSSYFGVFDLAGLPKNRFYLYKSLWTDKKVLHIFPHWTWEGMEGKNVPVHIFTNYPKIELFVNGISQGTRTHESTNEIDRFRMRWDNVIYQPGEITAVAYDHSGKVAETKTVKTASSPYTVTLTSDRESYTADGDDLCYITASIVDKNGTLCVPDCRRLTFSAESGLELLTTDAGDQRETESFARPDKKALGGMLVACLRTREGVRGDFRVTCGGDGLIPSTVTITVK